VVFGATLSVAAGALVAATSTVFVLDSRLRDHADERLRAAAEGVALDMAKRRVRDPEDLIPIFERHNAEAARSGIRLAAYDGKELVAGDAWVRRTGRARCVSRGELGERTRTCGIEHTRWLLVAAQAHDEGALETAYLLAAVSAIGLAGLLGGLLSAYAGRWAVGPVVRLSRSVRELRADAPDPDALIEPSRVAEVEDLRLALVDLVRGTRSHIDHVERFAANAAHELSTPLAVLRAELELLAEEQQGELSQQLSTSAKRTENLSKLVERLLVLAAPSRAEPFDSPVALSDVVERAVARLPAASAKRVTFRSEGEGLVYGDEALLETLVHNVLDNALKFSTDVVDVELEEARPEHAKRSVALRVTDHGPGISKELRERVFEPFFRARPDAGKGHGLGLALVRSIAVTHGGTATLRDAEPGTTLVVQVPACPA
jgi:signal transduction histidine kinase